MAWLHRGFALRGAWFGIRVGNRWRVGRTARRPCNIEREVGSPWTLRGRGQRGYELGGWWSPSRSAPWAGSRSRSKVQINKSAVSESESRSESLNLEQYDGIIVPLSPSSVIKGPWYVVACDEVGEALLPSRRVASALFSPSAQLSLHGQTRPDQNQPKTKPTKDWLPAAPLQLSHSATPPRKNLHTQRIRSMRGLIR